MNRTLPNILFICIIFMLATAFPLSTDILSINLSQKIVENPPDDVVLETYFNTLAPESADSLSNALLTFSIKSSAVVSNETLSRYQLDVIKNNVTVDQYSLNTLSASIQPETDNTFKVQIDKADLLNGLDPGYYRLRLTEDEKPIDYTWFASNMTFDKTLLATSNTLGANQLSFTLFYPDASYEVTLPITRHVPRPDNRWRALYTALVNGPKSELGLYETAPVIPYAPNIRLGQNKAFVYMYRTNLVDFESRFPLALESITRTFMTLGPLDGVQFLVDDVSNQTIYGADLTGAYTYSLNNQVYLVYSKDSDYMLFYPVPLTDQALESKLTEAYKILKGEKSTPSQSSNTVQVMPDEIDLLDYSLNGTVLTLNFNEAFKSSLSQQTAYQEMMVKSILYTFCSLDEVDSMIIQVDSTPYSDGVFDFNTPLKPDLYFNMEP